MRTSQLSLGLLALATAALAFADGGGGVGKDITARVNAYCDSAMTILNDAMQTASIDSLESDPSGALKTLTQGLIDAGNVDPLPGPQPQPGPQPGPQPQPVPPKPLDTVVKRAIGHAYDTIVALEGGVTMPVEPGTHPQDALVSDETVLKYVLGQYIFIADLERTVDRPIFNWQQFLCPTCDYAWASAEVRYQYFVAKSIGAAVSRDVVLERDGKVKVIDNSKDPHYRSIRWLRETQDGPNANDVNVSPVQSAAAFLKIAEYTARFAADDLDGPVATPGGPNADTGSIFASSRCAAGELRNLSERLRLHNSGGNVYRNNDVYATKIARDVLVRSIDRVLVGCR
jgi:hypothetical protein